MICAKMSGGRFDFRRCQERDCANWDKGKEQCNDISVRETLERIAEALSNINRGLVK